MRQVFLSSPWIHQPTDSEIIQFFNAHGQWARLPAGGCIFNGGDRGEIALVLSGLGAFSFQDAHNHNHIFALLPPGRLMGDVDGFCGKLVNVTDQALRETEVRLLHRDVFSEFLERNPQIQRKHAMAVIADHESDMEGMIANFTLTAPERITTLFASLIYNLQSEVNDDGFYELDVALNTIEISQIVSVARPTVSSILSQWQSQGLIRKAGRQIDLSVKLFEGIYDWIDSGAQPATKMRKRHRASSQKKDLQK